MAKTNARGAGRKAALAPEMLYEIMRRHQAGETVTALAKEYGVSRQTLSGYLNRREDETEQICRTIRKWAELNRKFRGVNLVDYTMRMDYMCGKELCTTILVDFQHRRIETCNETDDIIHRAFGIKAKPTWEDFEEFLESRCFPSTRDHLRLVLEDVGVDSYDPLAIVEKTKGRMAEDLQWIDITYYHPAER
jgi:transcriptional regulator with XRE-family HTH domain